MEPEVFLEQNDVVPLVKVLKQLLIQNNTASGRQDTLESAGINSALLGNLRLDSQPSTLAQALVAEFRKYRINSRRLDYHPMLCLLSYLSDVADDYSLSDEGVILLRRLVERGQENLKALKACSAVGRIESPKGIAIGTGTLISPNLLLTCYHVFSKSGVEKAGVRFNYKSNSYMLDEYFFELDLNDLNFVNYDKHLDYALIEIKGEPQQPVAVPICSLLNDEQQIRLVHHPMGKPMVISDIGKIEQVGEDYIDHNIQTNDGSSGAPIFNCQWELVAIHRGHPGIGRVVQKNTLAGVPISAFLDQIKPYI
jgi:V8-like Glu-specific endopeptidase